MFTWLCKCYCYSNCPDHEGSLPLSLLEVNNRMGDETAMPGTSRTADSC